MICHFNMIKLKSLIESLGRKNEYKWWMTPNQEIISLNGQSHGYWAINYLTKQGKFNKDSVPSDKDAYTMATDMLFDMGWVRLIYISYREGEAIDYEYKYKGTISQKSIKAIKDFAIERGAGFIHDDNIDREITLESQSKINESLDNEKGKDWLERHGAKFDEKGRVIAYHGTLKKNVPVIKKNGFKSHAYFSLKSDYSRRIVSIYKNVSEDKVYVFEVHLPLNLIDFVASDIFAISDIPFKETV